MKLESWQSFKNRVNPEMKISIDITMASIGWKCIYKDKLITDETPKTNAIIIIHSIQTKPDDKFVYFVQKYGENKVLYIWKRVSVFNNINLTLKYKK